MDLYFTEEKDYSP